LSQLTERDYPGGLDCFWIGCDSAGNVGMFLTAGRGPMPAAVLSAHNFEEVDFEQAAMELPAIGDAQDVHEMWASDDFNELARRGIFVFDWSDAMAAKTVKHRGYERMAAPTRPLQLEDLHSFLRDAAVLATIPDTDFCRDAVVVIPLSMEAIQPERFK